MDEGAYIEINNEDRDQLQVIDPLSEAIAIDYATVGIASVKNANDKEDNKRTLTADQT